MARHAKVEESSPLPSLESLTPTGYHRAVGKTTRRRIAAWPVVCLTLVVLTVLGWLGWGWADGLLASRAEAQASQCQEGTTTVRVAVDPAAEKPLSAAAAKWNQTNTVVRSHCIQIAVQSISSNQMLDALTGAKAPDSVGGIPAGWVSEASPQIAQLSMNKPEVIAASAETIANSPVNYLYLGLAGKDIDLVQKQAAQLFRDFLKQPAQQASFSPPTP